MASRRLEGAAEAEAARASVVQRWLMRAAATYASQPCVELRLRERRTHDGRMTTSDPETARYASELCGKEDRNPVPQTH